MNRTLNPFRAALLTLGMVFGAAHAPAQVVLPIEFRPVQEGETWINLQSQRGVPISATPGNPPGSDGRMPLDNESTGVFVPPTAGQFRGLMSFGAIPGLKESDWRAVSNSAVLNAGATAFSGAVAEEMRLPRATVNGQVVMVLRRGQIGAPFLSRSASLFFGSVVPPPETDFRGELLGTTPNTSYWLPEPYTTNDHAGAAYYWSRHARQVYAVQPGPLAITWRQATPYTAATKPAGYVDPGGSPGFVTNGANIFLLYTQRYIVSGGAVKPPRKIYWTEKSFQNIGVPVRVPTARVGAVNVVYNNNFPATVPQEFLGVGGTSPTAGTTNTPLPELRTLWYDQQLGNIYAYNAEGRVFVELLGDLRPDGQTFQPLGFEIVDVSKQAVPADVQTDLGELILPPEGGSPDELIAEPLQASTAGGFAYRHTVVGSSTFQLYAIKETLNLNDYLVHWLEAGEAGLRWPKYFGRYKLAWPADLGRYSHYLRPPAATEAEAQQTAVLIDPENAPAIEYQDPFDRPRAKFTADFKFFTWLDAQYPVHRTLLRYVSGEHVGFERVMSTLNTSLIGAVNLAGDSIDEAVGLRQAGANSILNLDGQSGTYGQLPAGSYFGTAGFSIEAWVRVREHRNWARLIDFGNGAPADNVLFALSQGTSGVPSLHLYRGASSAGSTLSATSALPLNQWVHLAATFDGSTARIYINGVLNAQGPFQPAAAVVVRNNAFVGRSNWAGDALANADFDNLRIWSTGRSAAEIFEGMSTEYPPGTGSLVAQFTFERLENPAADSSGNGFHMTLHGGAETGVPGLNPLTAPRYVAASVPVGERIEAPAGETGVAGGDGYLAGYILTSEGTSYNPLAYRNPFEVGFDEANRGAIIPVNVLPGRNRLEVWWFRSNKASAGPNAGNGLLGFRTVHWPAVIGRYTIQWPASPREIVLASKLGGRDITPTEATGFIYAQNNPAAHGYNPNEEHAIMSGGTPFATRDDLNVLAPLANYSSAPFVLVQYTHPDTRPAMAVFKVLREKPSVGWVFDYLVPAGQLLQPPPPLNFLGKPVEGSGDLAVNYNTEPTGGDGDLPGGWNPASSPSGRYGHYNRFTYKDRKDDFWVYRGPHAGLPKLEIGTFDPDALAFNPLANATAVVGEPFSFTVHASRQSEYLSMTTAGRPAWLLQQGFTLAGTPDAPGNHSIEVTVRDLYDQTEVVGTLQLSVVAAGLTEGQPPLTLVSSNRYTGSVVEFTDRAPFLGVSPTPSNSFTMRFYYRTEPSFAWPGLASPPAAGSIVPYLRPVDPDTGDFVGAPDSKSTASLEIVYRPFWPVRDPKDSSKPVPTLLYGGTVAEPAFELPGVRDFKTARILYQQSIAADLDDELYSAVLHDPTRAKFVDITEQFDERIPASVRTQPYQGKLYFPNLPPHLVNRVFIDPNRGPKGSLVLVGEYVKEPLGESYLMLNVLRGADLAAVHDLCPTADTQNRPKWVALVDALATDVEIFKEDLPLRPRFYVPDPPRTVSIGVGDLAEIFSDQTPVDSYAISATGPGSGYITVVEAGGTAFTQPGDPVALHVFKVGGGLHPGELKILPSPNPLSELITFQHSVDLAGRHAEYEYEWKIAAPVDGFPPLPDASMSRFQMLTPVGPEIPRYTLGGAGIQVLGDNYIVMRYRPLNTNHPLYTPTPTDADWSEWTRPALAEGWIKRVLAGINPFNQRLTDLFNNRVNTDVSLLTQAGRRWEGDVALNLDTINNYGLIEIYETVLRRGRSLSIESGFNYGPANDALMLAAGYLNDLYMFLGNEAWADAANPTIGIGTADRTYGDIATALFAFRGQVPSLLEEELALLRGRDDFFLPGVEITPVYNRLIWNYTRGIDAGEVIYALNYNILENPDQAPDGVVNAEDAARMFPQGHGDAYGHYLTALKGYYSLLMNGNFDWVPRIEAVNILGQPVSVDYQDERKFAAAAAAVARAGRQVFDLTWRKDYDSVRVNGWEHFSPTRENIRRQYVNTDGGTNHPVRYWGLDHWASRVGQGAYIHWIVGNAILPDEDPDPTHEGIQKVDRTTVPELRELVTLGTGLQTALDNAERGMSPLGIPEDGLALDINPNRVVGQDGGTHFEQIYERTTAALKNAVAAFDDAKDVTRLMRSEQDSLAELQAAVAQQEQAYKVALIELYGTPYADDIGPGKTYRQGYDGPDLLHYAYVDLPEIGFPEVWSYSNATEWEIPLRDLPSNWATASYTSVTTASTNNPLETVSIFNTVSNLTINIGPHGYADKPDSWTGRRRHPGKIQQAISELILAHMRLRHSINDTAGDLVVFQKSLDMFAADLKTYEDVRLMQRGLLIAEEVLEKIQFANDLFQKGLDSKGKDIVESSNMVAEGVPRSFIAGVASGGDLTSAARSAIMAAGFVVKATFDGLGFARHAIVSALETANSSTKRWLEFEGIADQERSKELRAAVNELGNELGKVHDRLWTINEQLRQYDDARRAVQALIAQGENIQAEREIFRQRSAAVVQGYRTRDAAFRLFRNEKLERYKTLFDLSARYALLAANVYDYETGLLNTTAGRDFTRRIINARALGVVRDGEPQFAGSNTGDPGLSSALAEMKADWEVLRGRLGFNNPDAYGTTVSLRTELLRLLPGADGDTPWRDYLHRARMPNILTDADVRRYCMQIGADSGLPVPGIVLSFSTTIADGLNLFGRPLAAGDSAFSPSSFATKIFAVGVVLEGYRGMANPAANDAGVGSAGGSAPPDPVSPFLDPLALAATPYVYFIPVGVDSMRSPPLGDRSEIRTWMVQDLAIPMPFNIGASMFSEGAFYQSAESLSEPLFALRKHQAFRPVSSVEYFEPEVYWGGEIPRSQFTNNRLIGRSVWNSQWKLVIPGRTLLNNPNEGLDRFLRTVTDVKLRFITYSYSGN